MRASVTRSCSYLRLASKTDCSVFVDTCGHHCPQLPTCPYSDLTTTPAQGAAGKLYQSQPWVNGTRAAARSGGLCAGVLQPPERPGTGCLFSEADGTVGTVSSGLFLPSSLFSHLFLFHFVLSWNSGHTSTSVSQGVRTQPCNPSFVQIHDP